MRHAPRRRGLAVVAYMALAVLGVLVAGEAAAEPDHPVVLSPLGWRPDSLPAVGGDSIDVHVREEPGGSTLFTGRVGVVESIPQLPPIQPPLGGRTLVVTYADSTAHFNVRVLPGWVAVVPPLVAIGLAMLFRQVIVALFAGVWIGALLVYGFHPLTATLRALDTYVLQRLVDISNASLLLFTLLLGGMVGIIQRSGGAHGIARAVTRFATNPRRGQLSTWVLGLLVFFDDYANTLLVGPTMRPITDRLRVSREKLAFLVDCTSAPVASLALVSSWIGVEVGYIHAELQGLGIDRDAYWVFVQSLPFRFYPWLMLFFVLVTVWWRRDFGPMWQAERRARRQGLVLRPGATPAADFEDDAMAPPADRPHRAWNAALPLLTVLVTVLVGLYVTGRAEVIRKQDPLDLRHIVGNADSFRALLWGSFFGCLVALFLAVGGRVLRLGEAVEAWARGMKSMLFALTILVLAWALGHVCKSDLHTGEYLVAMLGHVINPAVLPVLVFLVAAATSFATGSSWGTMGILFPLVIPLAHGIQPGDLHLLLGAISGILAGSVWGDHCSPISDTTILSSLATSCDHVDHVRTQLPYALIVALLAMMFGDLPTALGWYGPAVALAAGAAAIVLVVLALGRPTDRA